MAPQLQQARQTPQASGGSAKVDWERIMLLARGCEGDYIEAKPGGVRLNGGDQRVTGSADPVLAMQEGLPVLFHTGATGFQQRILKVDNKLSFCYILSFASGVEQRAVQVVPLCEVRLYAHNEALDMCKSRGVSDVHMTYDSTVVLEIVAEEKDNPEERREVFIFIAPPQSRLKERLHACTAKQAPQKKPLQQGPGGGEVATKARMDGLRLQDTLSVYKDQKFVDLEVQWLTPAGHPGGRLVKHKLKMPLALKRCADEVKKIEDKALPFTPLDSARVLYVLREAAVQCNWARSFSRLFGMDFHSFLLTKPLQQGQKSQEESPNDPMAMLRTPETVAHVCQVPSMPDEDYYCKALIRTVLVAFRQSAELHNQFVALTDRHRVLQEQEGRLAVAGSVVPQQSALPSPETASSSGGLGVPATGGEAGADPAAANANTLRSAGSAGPAGTETPAGAEPPTAAPPGAAGAASLPPHLAGDPFLAGANGDGTAAAAQPGAGAEADGQPAARGSNSKSFFGNVFGGSPKDGDSSGGSGLLGKIF